MNKVRKILITFMMCMTMFSLCTVTSFGATTVTLEDYDIIPTLTVGQSYTIYGHIKSNKDITRVEIGIVNSQTEKWTKQKYDADIQTKDFDIATIDEDIQFGKLKVGTYKYRIYAHVNKRVYTLCNESFSVVDGGSDIVKDIQKELNRVNNGTINGTIDEDGLWGDDTREAIKFFQQVNGIKQTGEWNQKTSEAVKGKKVTGKAKAINWAVSVANDDSFAYGAGQRAHRSGCYFCQTNTGKVKYNKQHKGEPKYVKDANGKTHTYTKTYCCNPFITAAYAHGAGDKVIASICKRGSSCGMIPSDWKRSQYFKTVGKSSNIAYSKLQAGDVILTHNHVFMYIGHGQIVESSGGGWGKTSIAVKSKKASEAKYNRVRKDSKSYVMRYTK